MGRKRLDWTKKIVVLFEQGFTKPEIAKQLQLHPKVVKNAIYRNKHEVSLDPSLVLLAARAARRLYAKSSARRYNTGVEFG